MTLVPSITSNKHSNSDAIESDKQLNSDTTGREVQGARCRRVEIQRGLMVERGRSERGGARAKGWKNIKRTPIRIENRICIMWPECNNHIQFSHPSLPNDPNRERDHNTVKEGWDEGVLAYGVGWAEIKDFSRLSVITSTHPAHLPNETGTPSAVKSDKCSESDAKGVKMDARGPAGWGIMSPWVRGRGLRGGEDGGEE
ncbi:hypothetical protein BDN70DRAFT_902241 [Pholiota conissans]|uniref:Uncharacterized protein n=1 Tax=Pholiota conissans TaxID=109636 RepID=A0A9P6CQJ6_9AGAR|nr:hypothetical protein BDN70DRAFT_902241 [Pholiota conissans]